MSVLDFPSNSDWERIYNESLCSKFYSQLNPLLESFNFKNGIKGLTRSIEIRELIWQLHYREVDVAKSFVFLRYYFEKGIPDDEWYKSPGDNGSSIQYYPHFETHHFVIKDWFDYYSDTYYHKLFSAWDTIGHIINVYFKLGIKPERVYFPNAITELKKIEPDLSNKLSSVINSSSYQKAKSLRNDITHNYLPSSTGMAVTTKRSGNTVTTSVGVRKYITSKEIMSNASEILEVFQNSIAIITQRESSKEKGG